MDREKQIEEMAKCCIYNDNGKCNADATESNECDLMCKMYGMFANLEMAGYRKQSEVVVEIIGEILEGLQSEIDIEDKYGRNAWAQGDISDFQTHEYTEDKLETLIISLSLLKKKNTEE